MAFELKDRQFTLFINNRKQGDRSPTMVGKLNIGGTIYDISAWAKESDKAGRWLSGSVKDEWVRPNKPAEESCPESCPATDDDLPF